MSEYQCYEFVALDRPLTSKQLAELRAISTRAEISPTRFWNEYQWGNLKADPAKLLARYFDAHLYFANWGTRRLMLRIARTRLDEKALGRFFVGQHSARLTREGGYAVLDLTSNCEEPEEYTASPGSLAALSPLREELMRGDLRGAYLAWLLAAQAGDIGENATEPPVPPDLATLTAAQQTLVEFLRIDVDLLSAAALGSTRSSSDSDALRRWVMRRSASRKEAWLMQALDEPEVPLGATLLRAFRSEHGQHTPREHRTVRALRALAQEQRRERVAVAAAQEKKARATAEKRRLRQLDALGRAGEAAWVKLERLVAQSDYDDAVELAIDLRELAARQGTFRDFAVRFDALHERQRRRRGFFDRWKRRA